ncbi:exodeoxyribonuclease VII large subunit [Planctomycetaceae bacterium SH139]
MPASSAERPPVLSVSQLTRQIKGTLEANFDSLWVAGEICDLARPRSGHIYFTLKDGQAQIRAIIWRSTAARLPFQLADGQEIICQGNIDVYEARGSYQFIIRRAEPQGIGALQLAFQQLQQRLAAEGLFSPERKRQLPPFPRRIGFVTSPTGAAVRDFLEVAGRRWPGVEIIVIPAMVQGNGAARSICAGIIAANAITPSLDLVVVGRGGGSLEDLWCFNEEIVVRALAASTVPTVSAVGHEIDITLSDLAADVRALTPSAAAEMVIPDSQQVLALLEHMQKRLVRPVRNLLTLYRNRLDALADRPVIRRPLDRIHDSSRRLDELDQRSRAAMWATLERKQRQLSHSSATLAALSPLATLARGYSITFSKGSSTVLRDSSTVKAGDEIVTRLAKGQLTSQITEIDNN